MSIEKAKVFEVLDRGRRLERIDTESAVGDLTNEIWFSGLGAFLRYDTALRLAKDWKAERSTHRKKDVPTTTISFETANKTRRDKAG